MTALFLRACAITVIALALSGLANAKTFLDNTCKPGVSWQQCFNHCLQQTGAGGKDMANSCSRRCTRLGCR